MSSPNLLEHLLYAPFLAQLVVTRRCNLACGYCNEFDAVSKPVPLDALRARVDRLDDLRAFAVELTGGEPMLHPGIYDLVRHARSRRFTKVMMISNAYLLNEEKVRRLNDAGLQALQISVDGVRPNAVTVKVLDPLRRKLEAVARAARFEVTLSAVLGSAGAVEAREVVRFAKDHGFVPRVLVLHGHDGQLRLDPEQRAAFDEVRRALGGRFREAGDYRAKLLDAGEAPFKCRAGSRYLYVDEHGMVRWCSQTRAAWGRPLETYGVADLKAQFHTPKTCNTGCTVGCARTCSAPDEWRAQRAPAPVPGLAESV
jgi:MoaA/NifB/PqqE/SkfB family radical SAM enzyme